MSLIEQLGVKGLHQVRKKVEFKARRSILPPDLFVKYQQMDFWLGFHQQVAAHCIVSRTRSKGNRTAEAGGGDEG